MSLSTSFEDCGCIFTEIAPPNLDIRIEALGSMCDHSQSPWITIQEIDPGHDTVAFGLALGECMNALMEEMVQHGSAEFMPHTNRFFFRSLEDIIGVVFTAPGELSIKWNHCYSIGSDTFHQEMTLAAYTEIVYAQVMKDFPGVIVIDLG